MEPTPEKQAYFYVRSYAHPNNGYPSSYMRLQQTGIPGGCVGARRIGAGRYITSERSYPFCSSWLVFYIYLDLNISKRSSTTML